jgi:hypothetical protein
VRARVPYQRSASFVRAAAPAPLAARAPRPPGCHGDTRADRRAVCLSGARCMLRRRLVGPHGRHPSALAGSRIPVNWARAHRFACAREHLGFTRTGSTRLESAARSRSRSPHAADRAVRSCTSGGAESAPAEPEHTHTRTRTRTRTHTHTHNTHTHVYIAKFVPNRSTRAPSLPPLPSPLPSPLPLPLPLPSPPPPPPPPPGSLVMNATRAPRPRAALRARRWPAGAVLRRTCAWAWAAAPAAASSSVSFRLRANAAASSDSSSPTNSCRPHDYLIYVYTYKYIRICINYI